MVVWYGRHAKTMLQVYLNVGWQVGCAYCARRVAQREYHVVRFALRAQAAWRVTPKFGSTTVELPELHH